MQLLMPCMSASRPSPRPPGSLAWTSTATTKEVSLPHVSSDLTSGCVHASASGRLQLHIPYLTCPILVPYLYSYLQYKTSQGRDCLDGVPRHPINRPKADCFDWLRRIQSGSAILFHQQININRELPLRRSRLQPSTTASPSPSSLLRCCSST